MDKLLAAFQQFFREHSEHDLMDAPYEAEPIRQHSRSLGHVPLMTPTPAATGSPSLSNNALFLLQAVANPGKLRTPTHRRLDNLSCNRTIRLGSGWGVTRQEGRLRKRTRQFRVEYCNVFRG